MLGHEVAGRVAPHSSPGTPTYQGWGGNVCDWPNRYSTRPGQARSRAGSLKGTPRRRVPCALSPSAPKPDSQQEGKNAPKRIIQWLLGEKIVNVLVPFTKPQSKKVTYKIPERKQCCSLWLRLSSCGRALWPGSPPRDGGSRDQMGPDHPSQSRLQISAVGQELTTEAAADRKRGPTGGKPLSESSTSPSCHTAAASSHRTKGSATGVAARRCGGFSLGPYSWEVADLFPQGSLKSKCPCWDREGLGEGTVGAKVHVVVYLADKFGRLGFGRSPLFAVSEKWREERGHNTLTGGKPN